MQSVEEFAVYICRDFVHSSYQELKKANPTFPILIRECSGVQARMIARYGGPPILQSISDPLASNVGRLQTLRESQITLPLNVLFPSGGVQKNLGHAPLDFEKYGACTEDF